LPPDRDDLLPLAELEAAVQRSPGNADAWRNLAGAYCAAGMFELGAEIAAQTLRLAPYHPSAHARLGMTLLEAGNARAAIPHFQKAVDIEPAAHRHFDLGVAFAEAGEDAPAVKHFRAALDRWPEMAAAWVRLAWALSRQAKYLESVPAFEKAIQHQPGSARLWGGLGRAYAETAQDRKAVQAYRLSLRIDPVHLDTLLAMGACHERLGQLDEAHGAYRGAARAHATSTAALCALAGLAIRRQRPLEALIHLGQALRVDKADRDAWRWLSHAHAEAGHTLAAYEAVRQWVRLAPKCAAAHLELGKRLHQTGRHDEAVRELIRAAELDPQDPVPFDELGAQLALTGRLPDAESVLHEALGSDRAPGSVWYNLGRVLNARLLFEPALAALERATLLLPQSAPAWRDLGWTYLHFLRNSDAIAASREALRLDPADASAWSLLGYVLDMERDGEGVREALDHLRHLDPQQAGRFEFTVKSATQG
jgi:tetratricopeptide (TPR) repeat protein